MIIGIGADLVDIDRIARMIERHGERSKRKLFTDVEIAYCERSQRSPESFAARFAAKEAFFKALGTGWRSGVSWKEVEVVRSDGPPGLRLYGETAEIAKVRGVTRAHLTLTHSEHLACAFVVLEAGAASGEI